MPAPELASRWRAHGSSRKVVSEPDADKALDLALAAADGPIVVAGSLYLVGAVRARLIDDPLLRDPVAEALR
jgi:folylpolyglutamate synthase/dihydropteroate synthase